MGGRLDLGRVPIVPVMSPRGPDDGCNWPDQPIDSVGQSLVALLRVADLDHQIFR